MSLNKEHSAEIIQALPMPAFVKTAASELLFANDMLTEFTPLLLPDAMTSDPVNLLDFMNPADCRVSDQKALSSIGVTEFIRKLTLPGWGQVTLLVRKKKHVCADGTELIIGTIADITSHLKYEKELEIKQRELRLRQDELQLLASLDPLTGILNRRAFFEVAKEPLEYAQGGLLPLSLLLFDLDNFKQINDTYGHMTGDEVLVKFVECVKGTIRHDDFFARLGGEEFALLLPDTNISGAKVLGERIRESVESAQCVCDGKAIQFTTSIGGAEVEGDIQSLDDMIKAADVELYRAKNSGKNQLCIAA